MKKIRYLIIMFFLVKGLTSYSQVCPSFTNSLPIKSGYNYATGNLLSNNVEDPSFVVTKDYVNFSIEPRNTYVDTKNSTKVIAPFGGSVVYGTNANQPFTIEYKFCLSPTFVSPTLNLLISADDLVNVYLNGNLLGTTNITGANFSTSNQSFFLSGLNTLRFELIDLGGSVNWLHVDGALTTAGTDIFYPSCNGYNTNLTFNGNNYPFNNIPYFEVCTNQIFNTGMNNTASNNNQLVWNWDFGDASTQSGISVNHSYTSPGLYMVVVYPQTLSCFLLNPIIFYINVTVCPTPQCDKCIASLAPTPGEYIVSCWVKEDRLSPVTNYNNSGIKISFNGNLTVHGPFFPNNTKNKIIDGWQRIEERFTVPPSANDIKLTLVNTSSATASPVDVYFDDIRIHPVDGNMKTYVYDPITLRLMAELDENNYATLYEYDEEGQLIRVKKETEKGIMTIKETRSSKKKQ